MAKCTKTTPWPGRRENVMFNKRRRSLFKKANELSVKTSTDLYVVMHRGGRYFTYNSTGRPGWPPAEKDVEMNYPLTERQTPSDFHTVRPSRRNTRQKPNLQQSYHEERAHVSLRSSPPIEEYSSLDLATTALLRAVKSGDIGLNGTQGKEYFDEGLRDRNELDGSGSADVASNFQLFEQHSNSMGIGQQSLHSIREDFQNCADDGQAKNDLDTSSASVSRRRKFVIPKIPDFSKFLERCT